MSESLFEEFELFYDELPSNVRHDLAFMMVTLTDENLIIDEMHGVFEREARDLFDARTHIGRIGNLINAVSIFDVYFAMDTRERFAPDSVVPQYDSHHTGNVGTSFAHYADHIDAIQTAKRRWLNLRATKLNPIAIAAALDPGQPEGAAGVSQNRQHHTKMV